MNNNNVIANKKGTKSVLDFEMHRLRSSVSQCINKQLIVHHETLD